MTVMFYAITDERGEVINHIVADEAFVEANFAGRWELIGPVEPPIPPLDARKTSLAATVNAHVAALLAAGAPVAAGETTLHIALDDGSRADLTAMATTAIGAASGALPWPESYQQGWITVENVRIPLAAPADGLGLAAGVGDRYAQIRQRGRDLKDMIEAAEDDAALDAIDIESGWPA
ncbi:DUF4376 domain-containing protein [Rhizobium flavescens]|uniref:DUF4376 domain-containing protein n=1 Tax=Rhizobium flavescens TaxID=2607407 RepID=UPI0014079766|nr:hypothetical protein [Rhizobium flavescens]